MSHGRNINCVKYTITAVTYCVKYTIMAVAYFVMHIMYRVLSTGVVTLPPVTSNGCVRTLDDCFNRFPKDYQYCDDCRMYASCAASGLYVRRCPGISVFDSLQDRCVDHSNTCTI